MVVALDERWLPLPLADQDPAVTATGLVEAAARSRGQVGGGPATEMVEQAYAGVLRDLHARGQADPTSSLLAAYALLAPTDLLPASVVEVWATSVPGLSVSQVVDGLVVPPSQRFGEPLVSEVDAPYGTGVGVQQLLVHAFSDGQDGVMTSLTTVWPGPVETTFLLVTAVFGSPVDAELLGGAYRALVGSLDVQAVA